MFRVLFAAALAVLLAGSSAVGAPNTVAGEPYQLNAIIPMSGSAGFAGKAALEAFRAIEILVNSSGGIHGHPLQIVTADTQTSPQIDLQLVNGLLTKKVPVFIDGAPSQLCLASMPLVVADGPVDYCLSPALHPAPFGYVFTVNGTNLDFITVEMRYFRERGWNRVATISTTDANAQDDDRSAAAALALPENRDMHLVAAEHFAASDISVAAQIARIKHADAQAVFVYATGTPLGTVLRGLNDAGLSIPVLTLAPNMTYQQMNAYAAFLPKEYYFGSLRGATPYDTPPGPLQDAQADFVRAFKQIKVKPDGGHENCWDATMIIVDALRHLPPNPTAQQIRDYIWHLHGWIGINGVYDFTRGNSSGVSQSSMVVARWIPEADRWRQVSRPGGYLK